MGKPWGSLEHEDIDYDEVIDLDDDDEDEFVWNWRKD